MSANQTATGVRICNHIFADGHRCGAIALRHELRCYYHQDVRRRPSTRGNYSPAARARRRAVPITVPASRRELQQSLHDLIAAIANNRIDMRRAGRLISLLQTLAPTLPA